jgi:hypothetical protein
MACEQLRSLNDDPQKIAPTQRYTMNDHLSVDSFILTIRKTPRVDFKNGRYVRVD